MSPEPVFPADSPLISVPHSFAIFPANEWDTTKANRPADHHPSPCPIHSPSFRRMSGIPRTGGAPGPSHLGTRDEEPTFR
jgi:hypothetical protein